MFRVYLGSPAKRFLKKTRGKIYDRIIDRITELASDPFPPDAKRVLGRKENYGKNELLISDIDKRKKSY